jgi:hypothetical protein
VGRRAGFYHLTVLVLVALLAWPWGVALSKLETAHLAPPWGPSIRAIRDRATGQRVNRPKRLAATMSPALLQSDTEQGEDRDDGGPPDPASPLSLAASFADRAPLGERTVRSRRAPSDPPNLLFGRLRC